MNTQVSMFAGGNLPALPAHLQGHDGGVTSSLKSNNTEGNRISIRGRVWRLIQDGAEVAASGNPEMDLAILAALPDISRTYYAKDYAEGDNAAPSCWSTNGTVPDAGVAAPCSTSCAACPMNAPGSGKRDQSRACRHSKRIAVALPSELAVATPANPARAYLMQIPATSLFGDKVPDDQPKSLMHYGNFLAGRKVDATTLVTRFSFDVSATQPTLRFSAQRYLEQAEFAAACVLMRDPDTIAMLPLQFTNAAPAVTIPGTPIVAVDVQPQVAVAVQATPVVAVAVPVTAPVEAGFGTPATAPVVAAPVEAGFGTPATAPVVAVTPRTTAPADAEPTVVSTTQAAASAGVTAGSVEDLLSKWGG